MTISDVAGLLIEDVADEFEKTGNVSAPAGSKIKDSAPLRCAICGKVLTYKGTGAKPKYCDDHKGGKSRDETPSAPGSERKQTVKTKGLEVHLLAYPGAIAWLVAFRNATDAKTINTHGPLLVHELCMLAETDKYWLNALTFIASPGKYGPVMVAAGALLVPIAANHGMLSPALFAPATPRTQEGGK